MALFLSKSSEPYELGAQLTAILMRPSAARTVADVDEDCDGTTLRKISAPFCGFMIRAELDLIRASELWVPRPVVPGYLQYVYENIDRNLYELMHRLRDRSVAVHMAMPLLKLLGGIKKNAR